jgi:hypothetical protein
MEIAGLAVALVVAIGAWLAYQWRRRAHGVEAVASALSQLSDAGRDGESVFVRGHGIFGVEGQGAVKQLRTARLALTDKKLGILIKEVEQLWAQAEAVAMPSADANAFAIAARHFEAEQPAHQLLVRLDEARARAVRLDRRRAGTY